jgi:hypothetical protein
MKMKFPTVAKMKSRIAAGPLVALRSLGTPLATVFVIAIGAFAQINSGVITGIVTDPQKAVVPDAKVAVVEDATEFSYSATTNSSGEFTVPYLKAGVYTFTVTAAGFPIFKLSGINVVTESTVRADVTLRLSKIATQVEVLATAEQLQTDSTTVESAVGEKTIDSTPNITQNPLITPRCWRVLSAVPK